MCGARSGVVLVVQQMADGVMEIESEGIWTAAAAGPLFVLYQSELLRGRHLEQLAWEAECRVR
jgi:hypothetical protein